MNKKRILVIFSLVVFISLQLPFFSVLAFSDEYTFTPAYWDACFDNALLYYGLTSFDDYKQGNIQNDLLNIQLDNNYFSLINAYLSHKKSGSPDIGYVRLSMPLPFTAPAGSTLSFQIYVAHDSRVEVPVSRFNLTCSDNTTISLSVGNGYSISTPADAILNYDYVNDPSNDIEVTYLVYDINYTFEKDTTVRSLSFPLVFNYNNNTIAQIYNAASLVVFGVPTANSSVDPDEQVGAEIQLPDYLLQEIQSIGSELNNISDQLDDIYSQFEILNGKIDNIYNSMNSNNTGLNNSVVILNKNTEGIKTTTEDIKNTTSEIKTTFDTYTQYLTVPSEEQQEQIRADEEFISDGETQKDEILTGMEQTSDIAESALEGAETEVKDSIGRIELITGNTDFSYVMETIFDNSVMTTVLGTACSFSLIGYVVFGKR